MKFRTLLLACSFAVPAAPVMADEGLWLFNVFPKDAVKEKYHIDVTDAFLENLRLATVRIGDAAGAFVSPQGLVFTDYRAAGACIPKDTFYAAGQPDEIKCPGLEASVLTGMEDVTRRVKEGDAPKQKPAEALAKRTAAIARIESACASKTGGVCTVVKLFSGERYDLYTYKKYSDLRLVFAPEASVAHFGGDPVNFTYERYAMDIAFLRAYEGGKPAVTPHYFKWSAEGVKEGDVVFAAGNPVATARLSTAAQLTFYHDVSVTYAVRRLQPRIDDLRNFAVKSKENQALARAGLVNLSADYKQTVGKYIGLNDAWLMARKTNFEKKLRNSVERDPKLGAEAGKVWDEVATAYKNWTPFERQYQVLESPGAQGSNLFRIARQIVRGQSAGLEAITPLDDGVEVVMLNRFLQEVSRLGEKEVPLKAILGSKTTQQAAEEYVHSTKIKDLAERKRLAAEQGGAPKSDDSMIRLARLLEDPAHRIQKKRAEMIETLETSAAERIAQYRYKIFGDKDYPDATGTLRATYGVVKGYTDRTEAPVTFATTFGGLYYLAQTVDPLQLPQRWMDGKAALNMVTPMDFASTCDITSGPSGAPVVNAQGEITGITFDGNLESIAITYLYEDEKARAVHVASQGIVEALTKLYKTTALLRELAIPGT